MGLNIKELRGGKSQEEFADIIGVSQGTLSKYEKGMMPPADILYRIAKIGNSSVERLLTGNEPESILLKDKDERECVERLLKILRTKQDKTVIAIKQNIDAFLDNPDREELVKKTPNADRQ